MRFADVPVFWLPFMVQSLSQGRRSGVLMPRFGINDIARTSSRYNRRIEDVGFYWAINDYLGAEVTGDWWANNYTSLNLGFDYNVLSRFLRTLGVPSPDIPVTAAVRLAGRATPGMLDDRLA